MIDLISHKNFINCYDNDKLESTSHKNFINRYDNDKLESTYNDQSNSLKV